VGLLQTINGANKLEGKRSHIGIRHIVHVVGYGALQTMGGLLVTLCFCAEEVGGRLLPVVSIYQPTWRHAPEAPNITNHSYKNLNVK